jgi:hypothetical protein
MTADLWETRDLPVLRTIVEMTDEGQRHLNAEQVAGRAGLLEDVVEMSLWALAAEQPPYFEYNHSAGSLSGRKMGGIHDPTGHARRTVGVWPKPQDRVDQLIAALNLLAEREGNPEEKSRLRKTAAYIGDMGRDTVIEILAAVATRMTVGS